MDDAERKSEALDVLREELAAFDAMRDELLRAHRGKWALFKRSNLVGIFESFEEAYGDGVRRFGLEPFLCAHITNRDDHVDIPALTTGLMYARL